MNRLLPPPTPQDIEAALTAIRDGTSACGRWARLDDHFSNFDKVEAEADRLWWVDIINPEGVQEMVGGGMTSAEAAAVAWISTCVHAWWLQPGLSEEDDAKVPRHVPEGWQFELHAAPTSDPTERKVRQRARLRILATIRLKSIARNRRKSLARK
jgi:hypothetical protein